MDAGRWTVDGGRRLGSEVVLDVVAGRWTVDVVAGRRSVVGGLWSEVYGCRSRSEVAGAEGPVMRRVQCGRAQVCVYAHMRICRYAC